MTSLQTDGANKKHVKAAEKIGFLTEAVEYLVNHQIGENFVTSLDKFKYTYIFIYIYFRFPYTYHSAPYIRIFVFPGSREILYPSTWRSKIRSL